MRKSTTIIATMLSALLFLNQASCVMPVQKKVTKEAKAKNLKIKECKEAFISIVADGRANEQTVDVGNAILFNDVVDKDGAIRYNPSTGVISVKNPGHYEVSFGGRASCDCEAGPIVSLRVNGVVLPASRLDLIDEDWATLDLIVPVDCRTTFEIINDPLTGSSIDLFDPTKGSTTSFFVKVERID